MTQTTRPTQTTFALPALSDPSLLGLPAEGGARLCGSGRTAGSVYVECGLQYGARPLGDYVLDPPQLVEADQLGLKGVGVTQLKADGLHHVLDWVGKSHYAHCADFLEEARTMGVSRKLPADYPYDELRPGSTLILYHPGAVIDDPAALAPHLTRCDCPLGHHAPGEDCAGLHWVVAPPSGPGDTRALADGRTYAVHPPTPGAPRPELSGGLFMAVPITHITVIADPADPTHADLIARVRRSKLPVSVGRI